MVVWRESKVVAVMATYQADWKAVQRDVLKDILWVAVTVTCLVYPRVDLMEDLKDGELVAVMATC